MWESRSVAGLHSFYDRTVQVVTCQFPRYRLHPEVSSMDFIAHLLASLACAGARVSTDFCWTRINARIRILSMSRFVSDTNDRISLREIWLFGRYRGREKRHREVDNARGNIVTRYVSVRIPSLTLSTILDLRVVYTGTQSFSH